MIYFPFREDKRYNCRMSSQTRLHLVLITITRMILNIPWRMIYPFIGVFSRGLGVDVQAISFVIAARSSLGLVGPALGTIADRFGRRAAMALGAGVYAVGLLLVVLWPTFPALVMAMLLSAGGKFLFDPAMQAFIGDRVDYQQRGLAIAISETSWSLAFILVIPAAGWLIARSGWLAPFPILVVMGLVSGGLIWWGIPAAEPHAHMDLPSPLEALRLLTTHRPALAALMVSLLLTLGNEVISVVYGVWMERSFLLEVAALGAASSVIGFAELGGEGLVAILSDRLGKRATIAGGIVLNGLSAIALPLISRNVPTALIGLFLFYITFEVALVGSLPLMTELMPRARATLMAANVSALSAGRVLGALLGPVLFRGELLVNGAVTFAVNLLAVSLLLLLVKVEGQSPTHAI